MSVIPAVGRQKQEDQEFKVSLCYIARCKPAWAMWQDPALVMLTLEQVNE
jgi:hypothetical protein